MGVRVTAGSISGGGGGASLIHQASRTLDFGETKALPSQAASLTGPTIVGAPGANRIAVPTFAFADAHNVIAYTNVNAAADLLIFWDGINSTDPTSKGQLNPFLNSIGDYFLLLPVTGWAIDAGYAPYPTGFSSQMSAAENLPLVIFGDNIGSGDFTGGDPDNTLKTGLIFVVFDRSLGRFILTTESGWNPDTRTFS